MFKMPKQSARLRRLSAWGRLISGGAVMLFADFIASQLSYKSSNPSPDLTGDDFRILGAMALVSGLIDFALIQIAKRHS